MGCFIINKPFDLGADTDHNPDTVILTEYLPLVIGEIVKMLWDRPPWQSFALWVLVSRLLLLQ